MLVICFLPGRPPGIYTEAHHPEEDLTPSVPPGKVGATDTGEINVMTRVFFIALATLLAIGQSRAQISDDVVKIGVLTDLSGLYSANTGVVSVKATKMAVEDFGGTVLGKKIEVVAADHQNKADVSSALARKWFDEEKVDVITSVANSAVALAVQAAARDKNRILINTAVATSDFTGKACSPVGIGWTYDTYALASGTAKALVKQGGDTWYFLTADYAFGQALERDTSAFVEAAGGKVLGSIKSSAQQHGFLGVPAGRRQFSRQGDRTRQRRRRLHQFREAGIGVWRRQRGSEARRAADGDSGHPRAWVEGRAGIVVHGLLVLGPER
jgi:ABC-type branched-subunit amino acid transport system substrate-binding protein